MRVKNPEDYLIKDIVVADDRKHKYVALLSRKDNPSIIKRVPFGDISYNHFFDKLGYYKNLNHLDEKRRQSFLKRHANNIAFPYSSAYFSANVLW